jgi:hypothetical protein
VTNNGPVTWRVVGDISERVARIEEHVTTLTASSAKRGNRTLLLVTAFVAPVVSTLLVTALLTWLHLQGT